MAEATDEIFQRAFAATEQAAGLLHKFSLGSHPPAISIHELLHFMEEWRVHLDVAGLLPLWEYAGAIIQVLEPLAHDAHLLLDTSKCMSDAVLCLQSFLAEACGEELRDEILIEKNLADWRNLLPLELEQTDIKTLVQVEDVAATSVSSEVTSKKVEPEKFQVAEYLHVVVTEAEEIIVTLESAILALENKPTDKELINQIFRGYHTIKGGAGMVGLAAFSHYTHQVENTLAMVREGKIAITPPLISALLTSIDCLKAFLTEIRGEEKVDYQLIDKNLAAIKIACNYNNDLTTTDVTPKRKRLGEILLEEGIISPPDLQKALSVQDKSNQAGHDEHSASIRVDITKLDRLLNLVGESVINHAAIEPLRDRLEQMIEVGQALLAEGNDRQVETLWNTLDETITLATEIHTDLVAVVNRGERLIRELQEQVMNARMVPIGTLFASFKRLVRDTAQEVGKQIRLEINGEGTELDKTVVEQLSNPFKHMIRNAIDHGIESPAERQAIGKAHQGTITLNAYHKSGAIHIEIADDGAGINVDRVLAVARNNGLISVAENLSTAQIIELLFKPGFSTAKTVSDLSGRGVGMDVVRRDIEALRGTVEMQTKKGQGTIFIIKLPLTMAIIDGMLVRIGTQVFIIPLLSIIESLRPKAQQLKHIQTKGELIDLRGEFIPLIRLHRLFHLSTKISHPAHGLAVVVESGGRKAGLLVDEALDQKQFVIKSLNENFQEIAGIAAATILNDGQVGLILDIPGILKQAVT